MLESNPALAKNALIFEAWRDNVRVPADQLNEGKRWIRSRDGNATICYEIAPLLESQLAVRFAISYGSGTMSGQSCPWTVFSTRQECIDKLLETAKRHFGRELVDSNCSASQQNSRNQMLELLQSGIFGFIEPDVEDGGE